MTHTGETFPWKRQCPYRPPHQAMANHNAPLMRVPMRDGGNVWLATSYEAVKAVLSHPDLRSDFTHPAYPPIFPDMQTQTPGASETKSLTYSALDGATHIRHRGIVERRYRSASIRPFLPRFRTMARKTLSDFRSQCDGEAVQGWIRPFTVLCLSDHLRLPWSVLDEFVDLSSLSLGPVEKSQQAAEANAAMNSQIRALLADRSARPKDGPLSDIISAYSDEGDIDLEIATPFAVALLTAGLQALLQTLSSALLLIVDRPDYLFDDQGDNVPVRAITEEILRLTSVADVVPARYAERDCLIQGVMIRAGEGVATSIAAANRDPDRFVRPDELSGKRKDPRPLTFGHGAHRCLGQHLARAIIDAWLYSLISSGVRPVLKKKRHQAVQPSHGVMPGISALYIDFLPLSDRPKHS